MDFRKAEMTKINQIAWDDTVLPFQLDRSGVRGRVAVGARRARLAEVLERDARRVGHRRG